MRSNFLINSNLVGAGSPTFVIAEVAQAHDGSLGAAHAYIDAVAETGANAVKFQTHIADAESTPAETWRVPFSRQDASRFDYWRRMEFTSEQWGELKKHADERELVFLSSPFSMEALRLLDKLDVPAWKVGSGEIWTRPMLEEMARTEKPVLLSTGMASWADLETAVDWVSVLGAPFGVFQCTTAYPCPPEKWGLNTLAEIRERFGCPVGYSDHSGGITAGLAASAFGADMLEVHVTFSRQSFGPDTPASVTIPELRQLVEGGKDIHKARTHPVDKDQMSAELEELREMFGKSIVASRELPAGHRLTPADLAFKKPGTGIPPHQVNQLYGCRLISGVPRNHFFSKDNFHSEEANS